MAARRVSSAAQTMPRRKHPVAPRLSPGTEKPAETSTMPRRSPRPRRPARLAALQSGSPAG
eukprot:15485281-Alexandrium_andersonii.AAC.1